MRVMCRFRTGVAVMLLSGMLAIGVGCNRDITAQVAEITASYLGEVVSLLATEYFRSALGLEHIETEHENEHTHAHEAGPLYDHEH